MMSVAQNEVMEDADRRKCLVSGDGGEDRLNLGKFDHKSVGACNPVERHEHCARIAAGIPAPGESVGAEPVLGDQRG